MYIAVEKHFFNNTHAQRSMDIRTDFFVICHLDNFVRTTVIVLVERFRYGLLISNIS